MTINTWVPAAPSGPRPAPEPDAPPEAWRTTRPTNLAVQADPAGVSSHRKLVTDGPATAPQAQREYEVQSPSASSASAAQTTASSTDAAQASASSSSAARRPVPETNPVAVALNQAAAQLGQATLHASHPRHGNVTIIREAQMLAPNRFNFVLELKDKSGQVQTATAEACLNASDPCNGGRPSLGYSQIDIRPLNHSGIGSLLHTSMAKTGKDLGLDTFVVEQVISDAMIGFCKKMGMQYVRQDATRVPMQQLFDKASASAKEKGWKVKK